MQKEHNILQCPQCSATHIASVLYGKQRMTDELLKKIDAGNVVLGGCVIENKHANYYCIHCSHYWA